VYGVHPLGMVIGRLRAALKGATQNKQAHSDPKAWRVYNRAFNAYNKFGLSLIQYN
jgi:hypothetical protein